MKVIWNAANRSIDFQGEEEWEICAIYDCTAELEAVVKSYLGDPATPETLKKIEKDSLEVLRKYRPFNFIDIEEEFSLDK